MLQKNIFLALLSFLLLLAQAENLYARDISRVIIDPGHGGKDKGAHRGKVYEKNLNLKVALKVEKLLKAKGIPVTMTRRTDTFISLKKRAEIANRYRNAVFISIHFNGHRNRRYNGLESFYYGDEGKRLAAHIHLRLLSKVKMRNRGTRENKNLAVLRRTICPAVLLECGYISNPYERKRALRNRYQNNCAKAIVEGIMAYKTYR